MQPLQIHQTSVFFVNWYFSGEWCMEFAFVQIVAAVVNLCIVVAVSVQQPIFG